jgi:hypothetical protein
MYVYIYRERDNYVDSYRYMTIWVSPCFAQIARPGSSPFLAGTVAVCLGG